MLGYNISDTNIHVEDSWTIRKERDIRGYLNFFRREFPENSVLRYNSDHTLLREWQAHNLLYSLGLFRSHTADVDLNRNPWYIRVAWEVLGGLYGIFH